MTDENLIKVSLPKLTIAGIAMVIKKDWQSKANVYAMPYINAMHSLNTIKDNYYLDTGLEIVLRFLCNAGTWRGAIAREVKKELNARCK